MSRAYFDGYLGREMVWMFQHNAGSWIVHDGCEVEVFNSDEHERAEVYYDKLVMEAINQSDRMKRKREPTP